MRSIPVRTRTRRIIIGFVAVGGLAVGTSACTSTGNPSATSTSHPSTTTAPPRATTSTGPPIRVATTTTTTSAASTTGGTALLAPGDYLNASAAVPHYQIAIAPSAPGTLQGTLSFVYQDGKQSEVFTFSASPPSSATGAPFNLDTSSGTSHTATITAGALQLPGCQAYLSYAVSASQCVFTLVGG